MQQKVQINSSIEVFFSYSHKDESMRNELAKHLSILKRQGIISEWHDRRIDPGKEWASEINAHLNSAQIILLLISADFLASDYCYDIEVKRAMERHELGEACVIPIILRPVDWKNSLFGKLQASPKDAKPITSWKNIDEAFLDIANGIRSAAAMLNKYKDTIKKEEPKSFDHKTTKADKPTDMNKSQDNQNSNKSLLASFLVLIILIGIMLWAGFLIRNPLFLILERYSIDIGSFIIYVGFVGVSLVSTVILFGILGSTGKYNVTTNSEVFRFGGAFAGFLVLLMFLIGAYSVRKPDTEIKIIGNVRFVEDGKPTGPIHGAKIAVSKFSGFETETDRNGNFTLQLPENQEIQKIDLQITYKGKTIYYTVKRSKMENVLIKIEKPKPAKDISAKWIYRSMENNMRLEEWMIVQNGNKLNISTLKEGGEQKNFEGRYFHGTGDFLFSYDIPTSDGGSVKLRGQGKVDNNAEKITGKWELQGLSDSFILERDTKL